MNSRFVYSLGDAAALSAALLEMMKGPPSISDLREQVDKFDIDVTVNTVSKLFHSTGQPVMHATLPAVLTRS
jgi:hypothetical protein